MAEEVQTALVSQMGFRLDSMPVLVIQGEPVLREGRGGEDGWRKIIT